MSNVLRIVVQIICGVGQQIYGTINLGPVSSGKQLIVSAVGIIISNRHGALLKTSIISINNDSQKEVYVIQYLN